MLELVLSSGWIGAVIALLALISLGLILERIFVYHRESILMEDFSDQFSEAVQMQDWAAAADICDQHPGHIPEVYRLAVEHRELGPATLRGVLGNHIDLTILPRLRARLRPLMTIARGAPMLGLMGTVLGMIGAFATISGAEGQGVDPKELASDIGMALGTTFLGLLVAVPVVFSTAYLQAKVDQFQIDLERYSEHCLNELFPNRPSSPA